MSSYYDCVLINYLEKLQLNEVQIIPNSFFNNEIIMKTFPVKHGRVCFANLKNERYVKSNQSHISKDIAYFVNELLQDGICEDKEKVVYWGDSLTDNEYEFYIHDIIKVLPYIVDEIPQHHYFLFKGGKKLLLVSFENEIQFGML